MEVLGHFIFELFKIAVLSVTYTAILFSGYIVLLRIKKQRSRFSRRKFKLIYRIIYALLFVFSFTYYGNHGLGDSYNIPLGHGETMSAGDLHAYFVPKGQPEQIGIKSYQVKNDYLCASIDSGYMIYNLSSKKMINFDGAKEYEIYAEGHALPVSNRLKGFLKQYSDYWNGWRFWVLP